MQSSLKEQLLTMTEEREVHLTDRLLSLKKGFNSTKKYLRWFEMLYDSLVAIKNLIDELDKKFQLARGLRPKYHDFIIAMLAKPPYPFLLNLC